MIEFDRVVERGYAKINLHLDVTGRLEGGYHSVATVMQSISLFDEITLSDITESERPEFRVSCNVKGVPTDGRNLVVKAALLFCDMAGITLSANIRIEKNIPMAAGMAGGSADGAAVLRGLNKATGNRFSVEELCAMGSRLGADVPFCIVGGTAYADGKGDKLHPFPAMPDCVIVAACEGEGVSTPWAYGLLDTLYADFTDPKKYKPRNTDALRTALENKDIESVSRSMYNIFESPVLSGRPVAAEVKEIMLTCGAVGAMMSGSGPSVFALFSTLEGAKHCLESLNAKGYGGYICRPV